MIIVSVPTIGILPTSLEPLISLWNQVQTSRGPVTFSFKRCRFLSHSGVAFLGGMIRSLESKGRMAYIKWDEIDDDISANLRQNGFEWTFKNTSGPWKGNSIPYRQDIALKKDAILPYLSKDWLGRGWINISEPVSKQIVGHVWELYANAFEHGKSTVGVFTCGQRYPNNKKLCLTVVDFGIGTARTIQDFFGIVLAEHFSELRIGEDVLESSVALSYAVRPGFSTATGPRGHGLSILNDFVSNNGAEMVLRSNNGLATLTGFERYEQMPNHFAGTIVSLTFNCDNRLYKLPTEMDTDTLF